MIHVKFNVVCLPTFTILINRIFTYSISHAIILLTNHRYLFVIIVSLCIPVYSFLHYLFAFFSLGLGILDSFGCYEFANFLGSEVQSIWRSLVVFELFWNLITIAGALYHLYTSRSNGYITGFLFFLFF